MGRTSTRIREQNDEGLLVEVNNCIYSMTRADCYKYTATCWVLELTYLLIFVVQLRSDSPFQNRT